MRSSDPSDPRGRRHVLQTSWAALAASQLGASPSLAVGGDAVVLNNGLKFPKVRLWGFFTPVFYMAVGQNRFGTFGVGAPRLS